MESRTTASMSNTDQQAADLISALGRLGVSIPSAADSIDDIAAGFDTLGFSKLAANQTSSTLGPNSYYHELHLEYPAMNILPKDATPYLWKPRNLRHRESPRMGSFHHDSNNLAFFARLETCTNVADSEIPEFNQPADIVSAIAHLVESPGISNLEVVAFFDGDTIQYSTRLRTTWLAENNKSAETHTFKYTGIQWGDQIARANENGSEDISWTALLQHLMDRASDRAYLHVRERLRAHSSTLAYANDQQWSSFWDTAPLHSPNSLLINTITWHEDVGAELPCACVVPGLSAFYLVNVMTEQQAAQFLCPTCSEPVLKGEESETAFFNLEQREDRRARLKAKLDEQCWLVLPSQLRDESARRPFEVAHVDLLEALHDTLSTFALPESVLPDECCPTVFAETATVTLCLARILSMNEAQIIKVIPSVMPGFLLEIAENALKEEAGLVAGDGVELSSVLPMGYREFLLRWFTRAVTLVAYQSQRSEDRVADELMNLMMGKRSLAGLGASW